MIQRIQTIYLFLAAALTIALLFIPIGAVMSITGEPLYQFTAFSLKDVASQQVQVPTFYIAIMLILSAVLSAVTIFFFKNRRRQMNLIAINMLLFLAAYILMLWLCPDYLFVKKGLIIKDVLYFSHNKLIMLGAIPAFLLVLANRAIRKDEQLVRSADRLR
ncbi:MAG: DUF4293 domain-containing protein [Bacteroidales bacterium]|nr:DUF4293 domain-containing protein [Bacteroidales bacterium]